MNEEELKKMRAATYANPDESPKEEVHVKKDPKAKIPKTTTLEKKKAEAYIPEVDTDDGGDD